MSGELLLKEYRLLTDMKSSSQTTHCIIENEYQGTLLFRDYDTPNSGSLYPKRRGERGREGSSNLQRAGEGIPVAVPTSRNKNTG